jgi:uncharacterized protein YbjT (DUF2867 family)
MKTIWLAGATGLVGGECLAVLLADPEVGAVVAVGRRAPERVHPKLRWQETRSFEDLGEALARARPDAVLCALGTTIKRAGGQAAFREVDGVYPLNLATAARAAGVDVFSVVTAMGAAARSKVFYNRVKGELEEALRALALPTVHVLHPSLLLGHRAESRPAERIGVALAPVLQVLCSGPLRKYRPIEAERVGRALARTAADRRPGWWVHEGEALSRLGE